MWRLPIQNHPKSSITEKRRNKAKYLTWNSIRYKFVKKTSISNPVKSTGYIKCCSWSSLWSVKIPYISVRYNCQKICSWSRKPKTILKIRKRPLVLFTSFSKTTNHRKKTNRAVVFSCRPFPDILKYWDHWRDLPTIWKTRLL